MVRVTSGRDHASPLDAIGYQDGEPVTLRTVPYRQRVVFGDNMPLDETGIAQPLEPALKRALLESGSAFEGLVTAAKDWEAAQRR